MTSLHTTQSWTARSLRIAVVAILALALVPAAAIAEEAFVTITKISGNRLTVVQGEAGQGRGMRGRGGPRGATGKEGAGRRGRFGGRGRGRFGRGGFGQTEALIVPADAIITSATRERRTFKFRVGVELAGGLRHRVLRNLQSPLQARIVSNGQRVTEVNVITGMTDINQSSADASSGATVIAVRPKRPRAR